MAGERKYKAFISYSHRDRDWGGRLHRALERYRVPKHLVGNAGRDGAVPARLFPIFRDREELPSSANLTEQIATALEQSDYLIVVCSPNSARSRWVNEEIRRFKRLGRADRILAFIIAGEPHAADKPDGRPDDECFPPALRFALDAEGNPAGAPIEPIAADARPEGDGELNAILKLVAGLIGVGFDDLRRRELEAQRARSRLRMAIAAGFGFVVTGALAAGWIAWQRAEIAEERQVKAQLEQSMRLAAVARAQHDAGNPVRASLIAAEALALRRPGPSSPEAHSALVAAYAQSTWLQGPVMVHDAEVWHARFVDEGQRILTRADDNAWRLWDAETGALLAHIVTPADGEVVYSTSLSPDRKRLLAIGENSVRLFDVESRRMIARLAHAGTITRAAFAAEGRLIVTATEQGTLRLWRGDSGTPVGETFDLRFPGTQDLFQYNVIALSADGTRLAVVNVDRRVQVWDVTKARRLLEPTRHASDAAFSRDGGRLALSMGKTVEIWDADMTELLAALTHDGYVLRLRFSEEADLLATVSAHAGGERGDDAQVWDLHSLEKRVSLPHARGIGALALNGDGTRLVTLSDDDTARMWETTAGTLVGAVIRDDKFSPFRGAPDGRGSGLENPGALRDAHFSPDGRRLVIASLNGYAQVWDADLFTPEPGSVVADTADRSRMTAANPARLDAARRRAVRLDGQRLDIVDLGGAGGDVVIDNVRDFDAATFSADGGHVLLTSRSRRAGVLDIARRRMLLVAEHRAPVEGVDFHAGRARLATADREGVHLWDTAERKWLRTVGQPDAKLVRFSPDGARVLAVAGDGTVRLLDVETGAALGRPMQHDFDIRTNFFAAIPIALFDPSGARVLSVSGASLRLWDAATGNLVAARAHGAEIRGARYSPDGRHILTASSDGTARLWEAASLAPAGVLRHRTAVFAAEFDFKGERIVTLSWDTGATLWDVASSAELGRMKMGAEYVSFSHDGKTLLAGWRNGSVWRWNVETALAPKAQLAAIVHLAAFPGLAADDRARYLADAGAADAAGAGAPAARDPCDVVILDMAWRWRPSRNAAVAGMSFRDRDKEAMRMCEESAKAFPDQPRFVHNQGLILLARGRKPEALEAFRRAADRGHQPATLAIGRLHLDSAFAGHDPAKAVEILRQASARGLAAADSELADLHWRGQGLEKDRAKAIALWRQAASRGDAGACRRLAEMEESGGEAELPRDLRAALLHWTLAVEIADRAGIDDRFARARRASLARHFSREGRYEAAAAAWHEALRSLERK